MCSAHSRRLSLILAPIASPSCAALKACNIIGGLVVVYLCTWARAPGCGSSCRCSETHSASPPCFPPCTRGPLPIGWVAFNNVADATTLKLLLHLPYWSASWSLALINNAPGCGERWHVTCLVTT